MVFKLVRTDADNSMKILLPIGNNLIGRGRLLNCDDKRISRKHGELNVTKDNLVLKALHINPCFYKNKEQQDLQILNTNSEINLGMGDKFGLLPDSYWFEIMKIEGPDNIAGPAENDKDNIDTQLLEETGTINQEIETNLAETESDNELLNFDMHDNNDRSESPSLIPTDIQVTTVGRSPKNNIEKPSNSSTENTAMNNINPLNNESNASENDANISNNEENEVSTNFLHKQNSSVSESKEEDNSISPPKRGIDNEEESEVDVKKVKLEPEDIKPDIGHDKPGTSNQVLGNDNKNVDTPQKTAARPRERCMYGTNCYRKNPLHLQEFSHPSDADWGAGERGPCPWGRTCRRRDPRHWQFNEHPPGVVPPYARQGIQRVERHGNNIYIMNAHIVNIHDDHFQLVDSDGESVDYDYEF